MTGLLAVVIAYLLGAIPFGYLLVRLSTGKDVRASGSGNIGATNVLRTTGRAQAVATLALDIAKGFVAVWIAARLTDGTQAAPLWTSAAALAVMAGHSFPAFLHFQGGKAVATFIGAFLYLTPEPMMATLLLFIVVVAGTRVISAASVIAAGTFPLGVWLILHPPMEVLAASVVAGAFIVYRHKANLERIHAGTENVFRWSRTSASQGRS
jgi:glycerol-3-phosphate acyltransferase PlsY